MEHGHETAAPPDSTDIGVQATLAAIHDQTRESLNLLRSLVNLLVQQHSLRDGPPLEELITTLIVQQREILTIVQHTRADVGALHDRLADSGSLKPAGDAVPNGRAPIC
jgi:hypothetical protein